MDMIAGRTLDLFFIAEDSPVQEIGTGVAASGSGVAPVGHTDFVDDNDEVEKPRQAQPGVELSLAIEKVLKDALRR